MPPPSDYVNVPIYQCGEGKRYTFGYPLVFIDSNFAEVEFHTIKINEPYPLFCDAVPAVGVTKKGHNELLTTVQYVPVDRRAASNVSDIGSGWLRMTVLVRCRM